MKKILISSMSLLLLVSCAQTIETFESGNKDVSTDPSPELTINSIANTTRAIAEGTKVPSDNAIGLFTNFHSDLSSMDYSSYNKNSIFGYDSDKGVWRGIAPKESLEGVSPQLKPKTAGSDNMLMDGIFGKAYNFSPQYWPVGDRVYMDYVAYSYNNLVDMLLNAAKEYVSQEEIDGLGLSDIINKVRKVNPIIKNRNRLDVDYEDNVLNLLGGELIDVLRGPIIYPEAVAIALGICAIAGIETGLSDVDANPLSINDIDHVVNTLKNGGNVSQLLDFYMDRYGDAITLFEDYSKAYDEMMGKGPSELTQERYEEVVNYAYWLVLTRLPLASKFIQDDLMYAHGRNLVNNNRGAIQTTLNHAKAWVKVVVNNQTDKDIFVSGISFDDIKTGGNLVIDNSKSGFEAYWDFSNYQPFQPTEPEDMGAEFEPYEEGDLGEGAVDNKERPKTAKNKGKIAVKSALGYIPDLYFVPSGCYGPALNMEPITMGTEPVAIESAIGSGVAVPALPLHPSQFAPLYHGLKFDYLNGDMPFNSRVAQNLGGAMFPAQEPGVISLSYYSWDPMPKVAQSGNTDNTTVSQELEMSQVIKYLDNNLSKNNLHKVTLNLPRQNWQMGKIYIYVLTIGENEITINPTIEDWDKQVIPSYDDSNDVPGGTTPINPGGTPTWFDDDSNE